MRTTLLTLLAFLFVGTAAGQTVIQQATFEDIDPVTPWSYTPSPAFGSFTTSSDIWDIVETNNAISPADGSATDESESGGAKFVGMRDLENGDNLSGDVSLTFAQVDVSASTDVEIVVLYHADGWEAADVMTYTAVYDLGLGSETTVGPTTFFNNGSTDGWDQLSIIVPPGTSTVDFTLAANQNGGSDYGGFDNVVIRSNPAASDTEVAFDSETASALENEPGPQQIGITATNPAPGAATTAVIQVGGTATLDTDYTLSYAVDGSNQFTVTFPAGDTSPNAAIVVTLTDDGDDEGAETITFDIVSVAGGQNASEGTPGTSTFTITNDDAALVINEFMADPDATNGDANGDGTADFSDDEFVELYNTGATPIDLSGYTLSDGFGLRHTFAAGRVLAPSKAIVIFGGGTPTGIPSTAVVASSGSLGLNNGGDTITIADASSTTVVSYTYGGEGGNNEALARDPDFTGNFVAHSSIATNPVLFSPGADNTDGAALPVELTSFTASVTGTTVALAWTTASETNNDGFSVEQFDGSAFVALGFVQGAGNAIEAQSYGFDIEGLDAGTHRFRLKQLDYDGAFSYSPEVEVSIEMVGSHSLTAAYPNPFRGATTMSLSVKAAQDVTVAAYDVLGRQVATLFTGRMEAGSATALTLDATTLSAGLYVIRAEGETFVATRTATLIR